MSGAYSYMSRDPAHDISTAFANHNIDLETFDLHFGALDWKAIVERYHEPSTTHEAREASIAALLETAITNPMVMWDRAGVAEEAITKCDDPEYFSSEEKKRIVWQYGLEDRDEEGAMKVLKWQSQKDGSISLLSEYGKEMLALDLTRRVQDTIYHGKQTVSPISRLPSEAVEMIPEKVRSFAEDIWKSRSIAYDSRAPENTRLNMLVLDQMTRMADYKNWEKRREAGPISRRTTTRPLGPSIGESSKTNQQLPAYDPGNSTSVGSDEDSPTYDEVEQALSRFTVTDPDKKRVEELRKQYGVTEAMPSASTPASENVGSADRSQRKHSNNWENFSKFSKSCFGSSEDTA
ncbi:hypothetical protein I203_102314 [Kwoniella mangroviensis CBS 8507]|uniref:uncharacterized protein n=1 Tax=Kwoniella mangroviensis CBS 8507 TaxID=1296122 RepID=UPI00080D74D8|nr:uncharacterized protein I203_03515 [Kwoniella mangroviensis CBS 8507]OCF67817.1 hypothetical protein I203_03515 [Kwoniella mangroviensis CBS 8507]